MRSFRLLVALFGVALISAGPAGASTDLTHPHEYKKRGVHWEAGMQPGEPGPAPTSEAQTTYIQGPLYDFVWSANTMPVAFLGFFAYRT